MIKRHYIRLVAILFIVCGVGWVGFYLYGSCNYSETRFYFDTEVFVEAHGWGAQKSAKEIFDTMAEMDQKLNKFSPASEISLINNQAGIQPVKVSDITYDVIEQSLKLAEKTKGAFDPTIGPIMKLWGFGYKDSQNLPAAEDIARVKKLVDYKKVILDQEKKTVYLTQKGMSLDLGAIAKECAVDESVKILRKENISSALISAGGDVYALGKKKNNTPWQIGIRDPSNQSKIVGYVQLENQVIDTSGDYDQFFWADGKKYGHIMDPGTGYPAQGLSSCTVIMNDPTEAEGMATAAFVLGAEKGLELIESENGLGLLITSDGKLISSQAMNEKFKKLNK